MSSTTNGDTASAITVSVDSYRPRVAIVTGAAQGIGYCTVHRLADDGIDIAVNDISNKTAQIEEVVEELRKKGRRAIAVPADVANEKEVIAMVEKTVQELGCVDIRSSGSHIAEFKSIIVASVETFDLTYAVNMRGVFLCYKYAAIQMVKQGRGGRLIGASSTAGKQGILNLSAYCATKFAVRGMTQSAAIELRKYGITVNTYAPGLIHTAILPPGNSVEDRAAAARKEWGIPNAHAGECDVIASIVSYLAKPEAHHINGQSISVDGGSLFD
ncbi:NAD-binding protein [Phellopilus nigrolimitatus]|nr:NAD-binding protein [Phellopilus nigrolimitatus]